MRFLSFYSIHSIKLDAYQKETSHRHETGLFKCSRKPEIRLNRPKEQYWTCHFQHPFYRRPGLSRKYIIRPNGTVRKISSSKRKLLGDTSTLLFACCFYSTYFIFEELLLLSRLLLFIFLCRFFFNIFSFTLFRFDERCRARESFEAIRALL